ncbi:c-type cytochrome [Oceaniglobus roseus]|uniref:c-type cytochrome n=1 Tax=Oceaniglobus roseus TaxID=1737570 RepID=UPI000C7EAA57|nr:cytochrome c [Kandeliimicrobium roseum]
MKTFTLIALSATLALGAVLANAAAHEDPVEARQKLMKSIGDQVKILGTQAKAGDAYDAEAAHAAAMTLSEASTQIPAAFETNVIEGDSEALPKIWENYDDFTKKADALHTAAMTATEAGDATAMAAAMKDIGGACKACHSEYRQDK